MLLDRRKVKFWQKWVFGAMAVLMAMWLITIPVGNWMGCNEGSDAAETRDARIASLQEQVAADPGDTVALLQLAEALRGRANLQEPGSGQQVADLRAAADAYEKYVKRLAATKGTKAEKQEAKRLQTAALENLIVVYRFLGDYEKVTSAYGRLTDLRPNTARYFYDMGKAAIAAQDTNTALLAFGRFLELEPDSAEADSVREWLAANAAQGAGQ